MKTTVVCGLLGSGKTTFIRNFLNGRNEKTVVLVNDFGAAGIDGEIFSAGGIEAIELPSGCVCCSLKLDLITTIKKIIEEFSPEHLMIEPSGVASPSGVLEALETFGIESASVIGIVDVTEFTELYDSGIYGSFFEDQIVNADIILINKTDLADEGKIVEAVVLIESVNRRAILIRTVNCVINDPRLIEERTEVRGKGAARKKTSDSHFQFETLSFRLNRGTNLAHLSKLFDDLAAGRYGKVARAKALIQTGQGPYRFDIVFGKVDRVQLDKDIEKSRLVVIGEGLGKVAIEKGLV